ncbi:response regulator transcription factor [Rhodococcus sp. ACT016]|uniref:helix-turn-helix transcriptional regulator n=1 Tax=Rhodococcus sp. ACT016 TaxID=3134808 RepID=UPI003D269026
MARGLKAAGVIDPHAVVSDGSAATDLRRQLMHARRPVRLAISRLERIADEGVDRTILHTVDVCPLIDVVVTLSGRTLFRHRTDLDPVHDLIDGNVLRHTPDDVRELAEKAGIGLRPGEAESLHTATGGLPALTGIALAVAGSLPAIPRRQRLLADRLRDAIAAHVETTLLSAPAAVTHRSFLTKVATAHVLTTTTAQFLDNESDAPQVLETLENAGILDYSDTEYGDTWILPPAGRNVLLARQSARGLHTQARLTLLAHHYLTRGEPANALRCASEADQWALAASIIDTHRATLVGTDLALLGRVLRAVPDRILATRPRTNAAKELVALLSGAPARGAHIDPPDIPSPPSTHPELWLATHQAMTLRFSGHYDKAADMALGLRRAAIEVLAEPAPDLGDRVPFLRMQWALTHQLAGQFPRAVSELRAAYRLGEALGQDYIARNAAGNAALSWALAGETARAHEWLEVEKRHAAADAWADGLTRIGGLVARTLTALDIGDTTQAGTVLEELGTLPPVVELWPFLLYARCRHAIAVHNPSVGLVALSEFASERSRVNGEFVRSLVDASELEVHLALGDGRRAMKLAKTVACTYPWDTVATARAYLLTGRPRTAIAVCHEYDWLASPYARSNADALVIEAVASLQTGKSRVAHRAWARACEIAHRTGCVSPLSGVPPASVSALTTDTGISFPAEHAPPHYPSEIHFPELTDRERAVLNGLHHGLTAGEIADALLLATPTVKSHLRTLYGKLGVHTRGDAVAAARSLGYFDEDSTERLPALPDLTAFPRPRAGEGTPPTPTSGRRARRLG